MRHRVAGVKLSRTAAHRRALFRNLVTALLEHEAIRTTDAKAKEIRRWADRMITLGKQGTLHARRRAATVLRRASAEAAGSPRRRPVPPCPSVAGRTAGGAAGGADTSAIAPFRTSVEEPPRRCRGRQRRVPGGIGAAQPRPSAGRAPGAWWSRPRLCRGRATGSGGIGGAQGA